MLDVNFFLEACKITFTIYENKQLEVFGVSVKALLPCCIKHPESQLQIMFMGK